MPSRAALYAKTISDEMTASGRKPRDVQRSRLESAEILAEQLFHGDYWKKKLDKEEILDLVESVLSHPHVVSRWGKKNLKVNFLGNADSMAVRSKRAIYLSAEHLDPMTVLHEISHMLVTRKPEADHAPGFCAILHYLITHIVHEEAGHILQATYELRGVKMDYSQLPPVRNKVKEVGDKWNVPGVLKGDLASTAAILRSAMNSGLFDDCDEMRTMASRIARRLNTAEKHVPKNRIRVAAIPDFVTIKTASLITAVDNDLVAEVLLSAVRNTIHPTDVKAEPIDPRLPRSNKRARDSKIKSMKPKVTKTKKTQTKRK